MKGIMGAKINNPNPLVVIIYSLGISLILIIVVLISVQKLWMKPIPVSKATRQPSQTAYPTYTFFPTYTLSATFPPQKSPEPSWIWTELPFYNIPVEIPENWSVLPINHRIEFSDPGNMNSNREECEDYLIIGPDGKQIITITMVCTFGEGIGGPCDDEIQIASDLGNNIYLYRLPDKENDSFIYGRTKYSEWTWIKPIEFGYWCVLEIPQPIMYQVMGKHYYEINEFSTVDRIVQSLVGLFH